MSVNSHWIFGSWSSKKNNVTDELFRLEVHAIADAPSVDFETITTAHENDVKHHNSYSSRPAL